MKRTGSFLTVAILFSACSPARIALDTAGWTNKQPLTVSGKRNLFTKESMQFGEYHTTAIKRSWTKGSNSKWGLGAGSVNSHDYTNIISLEYIKKKQTVHFSLTDGFKNQSDVYGVSKFNAKDLTLGNRPNSILNIGLDLAFMRNTSSLYYVQLYTTGNEYPWEMVIDNIRSQSSPKSYTGYLSLNKDAYYSIHPVYKLEGRNGQAANMLFGTAGFEFRNKDGQPVAAVSLIDKGVVYLQPLPAQERFLLANACAALLMQDQLG